MNSSSSSSNDNPVYNDETMTENNSDQKSGMTNQLIIALVLGACGLLFMGKQQMAKNAGDNTANLPATNERVKTNAETILRNQENARSDLDKMAQSFRADLDKLNERLTESIKSNALTTRADLDKLNDALAAQINRREVEQVKYIDLLDAKQNDRVDNPPSSHKRGQGGHAHD